MYKVCCIRGVNVLNWPFLIHSIKAVIVSFKRLKAKTGLIDGLIVYVEAIVQLETEILVTFLWEINTKKKALSQGW